MARKLTVYLCDLVHNYLGAGSYMFPLNIGYLKAFAQAAMGSDIDVTLFKYPAEVIRALRRSVPDVLGCSNYTWNAEINRRVAQLAKDLDPAVIVVFGGPNLNVDAAGIRRFFVRCPAVDFYVPYQGEAPFLGLLEKRLGGSRDQVLVAPLPGTILHREPSAAPEQGPDCPRVLPLDRIPSPYLTGVLDAFFADTLIPIVESNRGCPYRCTYCAQGLASHNRLDLFPVERVLAELRYIAEHVRHTNLLTFADANFGIAPHDDRIVAHLKELQEEFHYPRKVNMNWAKNQPKILDFARTLNQNANVIVSLQSLDPQVLKNVRRRNIKLSVFRDIIDQVTAAGGTAGTEIILGLPGETKASHLRTLRELFDWGVGYLICYNALVLDGTELSMERQRHHLQTRFRLVDGAFGAYDGLSAFETEEGIMSNGSMTPDELLSLRPVHWLIQFLWNYRFYSHLPRHLRAATVNPVDFMLELIGRASQANSAVRGLFASFAAEAVREWHDSPETLAAHFAVPAHFAELAAGTFGKMNGKYIWKTLLECRSAFEEHLLVTARVMLAADAGASAPLADIMAYEAARIIDLSGDLDRIPLGKSITLQYDVPRWEQERFAKPLQEYYQPQGISCGLGLTPDKIESLQTLQRQYAHQNRNVMLRKMTEHMRIADLFYEVQGAGVQTS